MSSGTDKALDEMATLAQRFQSEGRPSSEFRQELEDLPLGLPGNARQNGSLRRFRSVGTMVQIDTSMLFPFVCRSSSIRKLSFLLARRRVDLFSSPCLSSPPRLEGKKESRYPIYEDPILRVPRFPLLLPTFFPPSLPASSPPHELLAFPFPFPFTTFFFSGPVPFPFPFPLATSLAFAFFFSRSSVLTAPMKRETKRSAQPKSRRQRRETERE